MSQPIQPRRRLESWKQIADYLGCCERTAHRYEAKGIPVYRIGGLQHQRIFAYADELDHWLHEGGIGSKLEEPKETGSAEEAFMRVANAPRKPGTSYLRLDVTEGSDSGSSFVVSHPSTTMGRDIGVDIVLADPRISRRHARIHRSGDAYFLEDLQSRNGTKLNGQTLQGRIPLRHGDQIRLGGAVTLQVALVYAGETVDASAV